MTELPVFTVEDFYRGNAVLPNDIKDRARSLAIAKANQSGMPVMVSETWNAVYNAFVPHNRYTHFYTATFKAK